MKIRSQTLAALILLTVCALCAARGLFAQASASYAFRLELRDHIMARHSSIGACTSPDDFECRPSAQSAA